MSIDSSDEEEEKATPKKVSSAKKKKPKKEDDLDDDTMKIDVIVQKDLPDPRGCRGVRHRLCCRAILPTGIKLNTIEISIDREKRKVVLVADLIEALRFSESSMCQVVNFDTNSLTTTYQAFLNDNWNPKIKMTGDIPPDEEYENQFVHPGNNLAVTDPIMIGRCDPLEGIDLADGQPALVAHFFVLSVAKDPNGSSKTRRYNRHIFVSPNRPAAAPEANPANAVPEQVPSAQDMAEAHARIRARARARAQAEAERQAPNDPGVAEAYAVNGHRVFQEHFNPTRGFVHQQQQQQQQQNIPENLVMAEMVLDVDDTEDL